MSLTFWLFGRYHFFGCFGSFAVLASLCLGFFFRLFARSSHSIFSLGSLISGHGFFFARISFPPSRRRSLLWSGNPANEKVNEQILIYLEKRQAKLLGNFCSFDNQSFLDDLGR